jgi:TonB family protein
MYYPFKSFALASLIYLLLIFVFAALIFEKNPIPQISLELDAESLGEVEQHKQSTQQKSAAEKIFEKKSDAKKSQEKKLEPHESNANKDSELGKKEITDQKLAPIYQPLPQIPDELREEAFVSQVTARFYIGADGMVTKVELIKPSNNPKLNQLLLKSLQKWRFHSSSQAWTQDIRVTFQVQ